MNTSGCFDKDRPRQKSNHQENETRNKNGTKDSQKNDVYLGNIPSSFDDIQLFDIFRGYRVISIRNFTKEGKKVFAFLKCVDREEVARIVREMHGFVVEGRSLVVYAADKDWQDQISGTSNHKNEMTSNNGRPPLRPPHATFQRENGESPGGGGDRQTLRANDDRPPPLEPIDRPFLEPIGPPSHTTSPAFSPSNRTPSPVVSNSSTMSGYSPRYKHGYHNLIPIVPSAATGTPSSYTSSSDHTHHEVTAVSPTGSNFSARYHTHGRPVASPTVPHHNLCASPVHATAPILSSRIGYKVNPSSIERPQRAAGRRHDIVSPGSFTGSYRRSSPKPGYTNHRSSKEDLYPPSDEVDNEVDDDETVVLCVANFPFYTKENALYQLFEEFNPLDVDIVQNEPTDNEDDFTYALVTLPNKEIAKDAIFELDNTQFRRRRIVVQLLCGEDLSFDDDNGGLAEKDPSRRSRETLSDRFSHMALT